MEEKSKLNIFICKFCTICNVLYSLAVVPVLLTLSACLVFPNSKFNIIQILWFMCVAWASIHYILWGLRKTITVNAEVFAEVLEKRLDK